MKTLSQFLAEASEQSALQKLKNSICDCVDTSEPEEITSMYDDVVNSVKEYADDMGLNQEAAEDAAIWFGIQYNIKKWQAIAIGNDVRTSANDVKDSIDDVVDNIKDKVNDLCD